MKCPVCKKNEATVDNQFGTLPCSTCQERQSQTKAKSNPEFITISRQERIQEQRDKYAGDLLQPWDGAKMDKPNPDFIREYPDQVENYFTPEELKNADI